MKPNLSDLVQAYWYASGFEAQGDDYPDVDAEESIAEGLRAVLAPIGVDYEDDVPYVMSEPPPPLTDEERESVFSLFVKFAREMPVWDILHANRLKPPPTHKPPES